MKTTSGFRLRESGLFDRLLPPTNMLRVLGERFGIGQVAIQTAVESDDPPVYNTSVMEARIDRILGLPEPISYGIGGAGLTLSAALASSIGELSERYAASFYNEGRVRTGSFRDMKAAGLSAVDPITLMHAAPSQYGQEGWPAEPPTHDTVFGWTEGVNLLTGEPVWFPAQLVYFGYRRHPDEPTLGACTSSGCAAAPSLTEALIKGIYEQVERDAVMITWFAQTGLRLLHGWEDTPPWRLRQRLSTCNTTYRLFNATLDIPIPVVICACDTETPEGLTTVTSAGCHIDPLSAMNKALLEAAQGKAFVKFAALDFNPARVDLDRISDFQDNVLFYALPANRKHLQTWLNDDSSSHLSDLPAGGSTDPATDLADLVQRLGSCGANPIAFDLTTPDLAQANLAVGRVFVPELVQLSPPSWPPRAHPRMLGVPFKLGMCSKHFSPNDLHPMPHPFP